MKKFLFALLILPMCLNAQDVFQLSTETNVPYIVNQKEREQGLVIVTTGLRSCNECYKEINHFLKTNATVKNIETVWLCAYSNDFTVRRINAKSLKNIISDENIAVVFDDNKNGMLNHYSIELMPSLILFKKDSMLLMNYSSIFNDVKISSEAIKKISNFFKKVK